jgi:hypothetical protein
MGSRNQYATWILSFDCIRSSQDLSALNLKDLNPSVWEPMQVWIDAALGD